MRALLHALLLAAAPVALALAAVSLVGCQSAKQPGSSSDAVVTVKGRTDKQIREVAKSVFAEDGYSLASEQALALEFQRPGSWRDTVKWGGWTGDAVVIRAKLKISKLADDSRLLQLDMFAVRDAGARTYESENHMIMVSKKPYRRLLAEIGKRLQSL